MGGLEDFKTNSILTNFQMLGILLHGLKWFGLPLNQSVSCEFDMLSGLVAEGFLRALIALPVSESEGLVGSCV